MSSPPRPNGRRILISAGPTHEPIDAVRYIANRSSGRLGIALAQRAANAAQDVTLLLGPTPLTPTDSRIALHRFQTTHDLDLLLTEHFPSCDALVMAAAVADYRPASPSPTKIRRAANPLTLTLEPTPDLLANCSSRRRPGQAIVGFSLEPAETLPAAAREKLIRKRLDLVVANPLETMDSSDIDAILLYAGGREVRIADHPVPKSAFADVLWTAIQELLDAAVPTS
ncbi:MAG: hypothetical protein H6811_10335 [Phycisphaeraceae bacterium]|nr:hypothetical protein [Phycisphaeraceae bacterium]